MNLDVNAERIERIIRMEQALDASNEAVSTLAAALDGYQEVLPSLLELTEYYSSPLWRSDFEADEAGKLPENLKRGVLSEDAVYDLLSDHHQLINALKSTLDTYIKK